MKVLILTVAICLVFAFGYLWQVDHNQYLQQQVELKSIAQDMAHAASLYYDKDVFGEGEKIFNKVEGVKAANKVLEGRLSSFKNWDIYFLDAEGEIYYRNGVRIHERIIPNMPFLFRLKGDNGNTYYEKNIYSPTTVVFIDAGEYDYSLSFIKDPPLQRAASYEYDKEVD